MIIMSDSSRSVQKSFKKSMKFGEKEPKEEVFSDDEPARKRSKFQDYSEISELKQKVQKLEFEVLELKNEQSENSKKLEESKNVIEEMVLWVKKLEKLHDEDIDLLKKSINELAEKIDNSEQERRNCEEKRRADEERLEEEVRRERAEIAQQMEEESSGAVTKVNLKSKNDRSTSSESSVEVWEMRCHCGLTHEEGDTVECSSCEKWQHVACMGMTPKSNMDNYQCERCAPRNLPVTKAEAQKVQRKLLDAMVRAKEMEKKKKGRKSDPTEGKKQIQKSPQRRIAQLNEYSALAAQLLNSMPPTAGADTLLEDSRRHHKAESFPAKNALVTTENVAIREVILEVNGRVSMAEEVQRLPGGGNGVFMYDGLMRGTFGEDIGRKQEFICIETKNVTRRSCSPNCVLKHVLGTQATLGILIVATTPIPRHQEVTLPFDADWIQSDIPLQCVDHSNRPDVTCPVEMERSRAAAARMANKDHERRSAEEKRRAEEERRRLEEEARRQVKKSSFN
ncbi:unnamed protein product [Caenorhabditis nigoni]